MSIDPKFITNQKGEKIGVILNMKDYTKIIEELEMQEDIKLYDAVKSRNEDHISLDSYIQMRKKND